MAASAVFLCGCQLQFSERTDFERDVPLPDPGPCGSDAVAWRATEVTVEGPDGLVAFQSLLSEAAASDNLNFIVAQDGPVLPVDESPWPLRFGTADALGGGCYAMSPEHPPATADATVQLDDDTRPLQAGPVSFTVVARLPFEVPLPLVDSTVTGTVDATREQLLDGRVEGVILGEDAATILLDIQIDENPANDVPLTNFLGTAELDVDGDGVLDDYAAAFHFASQRVGLEQ